MMMLAELTMVKDCSIFFCEQKMEVLLSLFRSKIGLKPQEEWSPAMGKLH